MMLVRYLRDAALFLPCYLLLDWVSYIHPLGAFNITPWNPQPGLAIVWMLLGGLIYAPVVFASIVVADAAIRHIAPFSATTIVAALTLTIGYAALAAAVRGKLRPFPTLHTIRRLTFFVSVVIAGTALIAACFVGVLHAAGALESGSAVSGWLRFWVGDAVGVLVTAPLLLAAANPEGRRGLRAFARRGETYLQIALVAATLWLIFAAGDPSHHFYVLFLPLIWIAIRSGMAGAIIAIAIVQIGVVLGIHDRPQTVPIIELQALVAALTLTALYLGVTVEERARAIEGLKQSLRLAAAGEMAGAIAHEVNQPLTALANYGRAVQMLVAAGRSGEVPGVVERMLGEAQRASEVVRRLRDFFRQGTTRLEQVPISGLLEAASGIARQTGNASLTIAAEPDLPDLLVDKLQIELVLRNLVTNAVEAVAARAARGGGGGEIAITAKRHDARHLRIVVSDSGPGIGATAAERVFEPFVSGKPSGMGLGLAISRAIAEAHGGTLDAHPAAHGEFHLVLPFHANG